MITDWQKLPKFVVLIGSFVFNWVLLILMLKTISAIDIDWLHLMLALPFSYQQMAPSKLDQWDLVAFIGQYCT